MGISASQARLLSLTARIANNEYESQQISNSKMRLATQSADASAEYIKALNSTQLEYISFDEKGQSSNVRLTPNVLYQYSDMKNQYILSNAAGQVLLPSEDVINYKNAKDLDDFLSMYGIEQTFRSSTMQENYNKVKNSEKILDEWKKQVTTTKDNADKDTYYYAYNLSSGAYFNRTEIMLSDINGTIQTLGYGQDDEKTQYVLSYCKQKKDDSGKYVDDGTPILIGKNGETGKNYSGDIKDLISIINNNENNDVYKITTQKYVNGDAVDGTKKDYYIDNTCEHIKYTSDKQYEQDKYIAPIKCNEAAALYEKNPTAQNLQKLNDAYQDVYNTNSYDQWLRAETRKRIEAGHRTTIDENGEEIDPKAFLAKVDEYYEALNAFLTEAEEYGITSLEYCYSYSDENKATWYTNLWYRLNGDSSIKNSSDVENYQVLDFNLSSSAQWLQDSLTQGFITIEQAQNVDKDSLILNEVDKITDVLERKLRGISWDTKIWSSATDIKQKDDDKAITKAEAKYQERINDISAKDLKLQNKIKLLDSEHTALQNQYDSIKSALDKNIGRSYKTFNS